jgi:hypothetical protein
MLSGPRPIPAVRAEIGEADMEHDARLQEQIDGGTAMSTDPHRPSYHFLPPRNWMNDPNGLIYWGGEYHLFYQHNPNGPFWGTMHWGHAVSPDLVRWRHLPIALAPTPGGPDKDGCFSGSAVDNDGVPALVYTGVSPEVQCVATSDDGMITWQKHPGNPVIAAPPEGLDVTGFRDPFVWRENEEWRMVVGSGLRGVGGAALLYRSPDLIRWEYLQPLCTGDIRETGEMWECPNFFPLGDRHVLIVSPVPLRKALYFVGRYDGARFTPERHGVLDAGGHYYASLSLVDAAGRRVIFGWLWEGRSDAAQRRPAGRACSRCRVFSPWARTATCGRSRCRHSPPSGASVAATGTSRSLPTAPPSMSPATAWRSTPRSFPARLAPWACASSPLLTVPRRPFSSTTATPAPSPSTASAPASPRRPRGTHAASTFRSRRTSPSPFASSWTGPSSKSTLTPAAASPAASTPPAPTAGRSA